MRDWTEARRGAVFTMVGVVWICSAQAVLPTTAQAQPAASGPGTTPAASSGPAFPSKLVRYVVPFGAGASPDIVGRLLADRLTRLWGQQVIVCYVPL